MLSQEMIYSLQKEIEALRSQVVICEGERTALRDASIEADRKYEEKEAELKVINEAIYYMKKMLKNSGVETESLEGEFVYYMV